MSDSPFDAYVGLIEAGEMIPMHYETVRKWIKKGVIPAIKWNQTWLIRREHVEAFRLNYLAGPSTGPVSRQHTGGKLL